MFDISLVLSSSWFFLISSRQRSRDTDTEQEGGTQGQGEEGFKGDMLITYSPNDFTH